MTSPIGSVNDYLSYYRHDDEEQWPVTYQPRQRLQILADTSHPELYFSPLEDSMPVWQPSRRRVALDRWYQRFETSKYPGSEQAVEYLHEKYCQNMTLATIKQAGGVVLSFLEMLGENNVALRELTRKDIARMRKKLSGSG